MSEQTTKVTLPKEVAEAIEELRSKFGTNFSVIHQVHGAFSAEPQMTVKQWALDRNDGYDDLMSALVNGYYVEQTPEEKLAEYYEGIQRRNTGVASTGWHEASGVQTTLSILGITIEGINAKEATQND